jgi:molybdenum cofactor cytidylyltransferase
VSRPGEARGWPRPAGVDENDTMVPAIILAAGASSRMGRPKALLPDASGTPFVARLARALLDGGAEDLIVVVAPSTGHRIGEALAAAGVAARLAVNADPSRGQLSSILTGLAVADHPGVQAVLVHLVDQPFVDPDTVRKVLAAHRASRAPVVRPRIGDRHGHPVLFDRRVFEELRRVDPAVGARAVVRAHLADAVAVVVADQGAIADIDTPEDYERIVGRPLPEAGN